MSEIRLSESDRTVFAVCPNCNKTGLGRNAPDYYSMAYSRKQWSRGQQCENCKSTMEKVYEVNVDE